VNVAAALNAQHFVGRAPEQVAEFISEVVEPIRRRYTGGATLPADVNV
jgi:adenylosuccinate lyase